MLVTDIIIIAALVAIVVLWWKRTLPERRKYLIIVAGMTLAVAITAILNYRWQSGFAAAVAALVLIVQLTGHLRKSEPRKGIPWISGPLVTILSVVAFLAIYWFPVSQLPAPSGEYDVGFRDFEVVDESRLGVNGVAKNEPRRLLVKVWYPSDDVSGLNPRPYFSELEVQTTATGMGRSLGMSFLLQHLGRAKTNSYEDAPLLTGAADLPAVFYSHGYGLFAQQNTALMEELASHGYIVYSVHHSGDGADAAMPNGDVVPTDPALDEMAMPDEETMQAMQDQMINIVAGETLDIRYNAILGQREENESSGQRISTVSAEVWTKDRIFVHDALESGDIDESVADVVAASNLQRTGQMGMSFGGSATGDVCQKDVRCAAGINLDGGEFHYSSHNQHIAVPFMMMYSDPTRMLSLMGGNEDQIARARPFNDFAYERFETAGHRDDVLRVITRGSDHGTYSDFKWYVRTPLLNAALGTLDPATSLSFQNDFVLGFFDRYVLGIDNNFPQAQFETWGEISERNEMAPLADWWVAAHPEDETVSVVLETSRGEIELALYPNRAPVTVANFLEHVRGGHYDGAHLYRVAHAGNSSPERVLSIVQGGVLSFEDYLEAASTLKMPPTPLPPIEHETTTSTGINNERGVVSIGRLEPGTAASEFFINIGDNPLLDTSEDASAEPGYATFGRVVRGLRILDWIQMEATMPVGDATGAEAAVRAQVLAEPVVIMKARILSPDS